MAPLHGPANDGDAWLSYGVHRSVLNPVVGLFGGTAEAYSAIGGDFYGARLLAEAKFVGLSAGVDWSIPTHSLATLISFQTAIRRGGILSKGTMLRVDYLPARSQSVAMGLTVPVFRPLAGRTRPHKTKAYFALPGKTNGNAASGASDVQALRVAAEAIAAFSNAFAERPAQIIVHHAGGYAAATRAYDAALQRSFMTALGDSLLAHRVAARGRELLLDYVVLPIDSLFGRVKENPDDLTPLTNAAIGALSQWLSDSVGVKSAGKTAAIAAFASWMNVIREVHNGLLADAKDPRLAWLPLDLALHAADFDEQTEVDSLIARAVGHPFTDRNALAYLRSSELPLEIARSIYAAREYHVLWTHDFAGRRESGAIDNIGYSMVADAYLPALTAAVKRYDSTGVIPTYMILQDEFFYEPRDNRLWMNILQDPLNASMRLRGDTGQRELHLLERQVELRDAVAASARLQRDAAASGNPRRWLRRTVKVHVNIVEPSDFSFRSNQSIPGIPFTPDNIMRDHRKIVFYDLNEVDSYRGAMLLMGVGIGEHYASATWEDRGYRLRGPATLEVRRGVREALRRNGFRDTQIPAPLRAVANAVNAERRMDVGDYVGRALQVHNEVGFARKESSVARAMLYNLAPAGSVIIVPDPMWLSDTWAGVLAGAAARGCRVYIIAPASANAPSPQAPLLAVQHDIMKRLLDLRTALAPQIRASGGELRIGLFAAQADVNDAAGRTREIRAGLARSPWIRQVIPFDEQTLAVLQRAETQAAGEVDASSLAHDEKPRAQQLHQKSQLIARPGAIAALVRQPGWDDVLARSIRVQSAETARFAEQITWTNPQIDTAATRSTDMLMRGYEQSLTENERKNVSFYFSLGTQNQDPRGIVSDGEATLIVSGVQASVGLVDLFYLMARSSWIESESQLDKFVPPKSKMVRRLAHKFRAAF